MSDLYVTGIDPGFTGACATVKFGADDSMDVVDVVDLPTKLYPSEGKGKVKSGKGGRRGCDLEKLLHYLRKRCAVGRIYLESNLIMDSDSLYSTASTAFGAGLLLGMGYTLGGDVKFVSPRHWQAVLGKDEALMVERSGSRVSGRSQTPSSLLSCSSSHSTRSA